MPLIFRPATPSRWLEMRLDHPLPKPHLLKLSYPMDYSILMVRADAKMEIGGANEMPRTSCSVAFDFVMASLSNSSRI